MSSPELDFRLLFEQSPDVLLVLLPDSPRFTMAGATGARLAATHTTREATIGKGLFEVFPDNPDDPGATGATNLRASLERVLATRQPDTMAVQKYDIRGPDGTFVARYWSPRNLPVLSAAGEIAYILHRVEDVTELVHAAEAGDALRDRSNAMEREVIQRSRELAAAILELRGANAQLAEAHRELDSFSYSVSHDLRAPLRAIDGFRLALAEECAAELGSAGQDYLERIGRNVKKMTALIDDLLKLARISRAPLQTQAVDVSALAHEVAMDVAQHSGRAVAVDIEPGLTAEADANLLRIVLTNLVGNAWKFSARVSDPRIAVGRAPEGERPFYVRDNGAGFEMQFAHKLFAPFQRLHTADEFEGTGIGLAIVARIVHRHGGRVWAEGAVGAGATVYFTLGA